MWRSGLNGRSRSLTYNGGSRMADVTVPSALGGERRLQRIGVASLCLAFAFVCGATTSSSSVSGGWPTRSVALGILTVVLAGIGCALLCQAAARLHGWLALAAHIGPAWVLYVTFTFGVTSVAWLHHEPAGVPSVAADSVVTALVVVAVAVASWTAGYLLPPIQLFATSLRRLSAWSSQEVARRLRPANLPVILYAISMAARVIRLRAGRFGYLQDPTLALSSPSGFYALLALLDGLAVLAILLAALDSFQLSRSRRAKVTLAVLLFIEAGVGLFSASKQTVLVTTAAPGLLYILTQRRVPRLPVILFGIAAVVIFSFNASYRNAIRSSSTQSIAPSSAITALPRALLDTVTSNPISLVQHSVDNATIRARNIDNVALVVDKTPRAIPYRSWTELVTGPVSGLIPRILWPSKPVLSTGQEFTNLYYQKGVLTATAVTTPGDLYRHGGLTPLVLGTLFLGALARLFDSAFDPVHSARHAVVLIPLLLLLVKSETDFISLVVSIVGTLALSVVVVRYGVSGDPKRV